MLKKRGQVSTFIIIGIVFLMAFMLIFFLRDSIREKFIGAVNQQEYLNSQLNQIKRIIDSCAAKETINAVDLLSESGGYFNPVEYITYHGMKVSILCSNIQGQKYCNAKPLSIEEVNSRLNSYLTTKVRNCINIGSFRNKDYILTTGDFNLKTNLLGDSLNVEINYPVKLTLPETEAKTDKFVNNIKAPIGQAVLLANTIISGEATDGEFDTVTASLLSRGTYIIEERHSYPHKIYIIDFWNGKYKFYLGVEGEA